MQLIRERNKCVIDLCLVSSPEGSEVTSYRQTLREVEAVLFLADGGRLCGGVVVVGAAVDGAEEARLMEAQLLQLLWVLRERGGEQQLLQRHVWRRQTARCDTDTRTGQLYTSSFM